MKAKNIFIIALAFCAITISSCQDDNDIEEQVAYTPDYILPQEGASASANARIQQLYNRYGSYFLYKFDEKDAFWTQTVGQAMASGTNHVTEGDPANVEAMLDFIEDAWLKYFSDDFMKKGGAPYRVFLADSLYNARWINSYNPYWYYTHYDYMINGNSIIIAGMDKISTLTETQKKVKKVNLLNAIWEYYVGQSVVSIPEKFYEGTDYTTAPDHSSFFGSFRYNAEQTIGLRNRGFLPNYKLNANGTVSISEWITNNTAWTNGRTNDLNAYMSMIFNATDEEMEEYLEYPLIKQKWDILISWYKEQYDLDLRKIAEG